MKPNTPEQTKSPLIAIVDDEECVRESLSSLIRSVGYRVEDYPSAESFLAWGRCHETDCLILDIRLQGASGLEFQRQLTGMGCAYPPIIFISGHASGKEQIQAATGGAVAFLRKPFSDEALLEAVRKSISRGRTVPSLLFNFMGSPEPAGTVMKG